MDFKQTLLDIVKNNREPDWLKDLRLAALARFETQPQPAKTDEDWRRVDVNQFLFSDLALQSGVVPSARNAAPWKPSPESATAAVETEFFAAPEGVILSTLSEAARQSPELVRPYLEQAADGNGGKFAALSDALWNGGVFLHVAKNVEASLPLGLIYRTFHGGLKAEGARKGFLPRILMVLEENSSACFVADEISAREEEGWVNAITDVHLKPGARLSYLSLQRLGRGATALSRFRASLEKSASLNVMAVESGAGLAKAHWECDLQGEGASARLYGITRGEGAQHFDQTAYVGHLAPNAQSRVLFKSALRDKARSVFAGLIHVRKAAQKTDAYQTNRNLLLSKEARADTIPKLEIEADDVKCGHGAAVSSIDPDQLYYLMSRGLARPDAESMIVAGFYEDVLNQWLENSPFARREQERALLVAWVDGLLQAPQAAAAV